MPTILLWAGSDVDVVSSALFLHFLLLHGCRLADLHHGWLSGGCCPFILPNPADPIASGISKPVW